MQQRPERSPSLPYLASRIPRDVFTPVSGHRLDHDLGQILFSPRPFFNQPQFRAPGEPVLRLAQLGRRKLFRLVLKNRKLPGGEALRNGETGRLVKIGVNGLGHIEFQVRRDADGQILRIDTAEYRRLDYGYAVNTHKSQGLTVDHVSALAGGGVTDLNSLYVQLSRLRIGGDITLPRGAVEAMMAAHGPSRRMVGYAEDLARRGGIPLSAAFREDFLVCRGFLNEHAARLLGDGGRPRDPLRNVADLVEAMGEARIKDSTLGYAPVPATVGEAGRGAGMEPQEDAALFPEMESGEARHDDDPDGWDRSPGM